MRQIIHLRVPLQVLNEVMKRLLLAFLQPLFPVVNQQPHGETC